MKLERMGAGVFNEETTSKRLLEGVVEVERYVDLVQE